MGTFVRVWGGLGYRRGKEVSISSVILFVCTVTVSGCVILHKLKKTKTKNKYISKACLKELVHQEEVRDLVLGSKEDRRRKW